MSQACKSADPPNKWRYGTLQHRTIGQGPVAVGLMLIPLCFDLLAVWTGTVLM